MAIPRIHGPCFSSMYTKGARGNIQWLAGGKISPHHGKIAKYLSGYRCLHRRYISREAAAVIYLNIHLRTALRTFRDLYLGIRANFRQNVITSGQRVPLVACMHCCDHVRLSPRNNFANAADTFSNTTPTNSRITFSLSRFRGRAVFARSVAQFSPDRCSKCTQEEIPTNRWTESDLISADTLYLAHNLLHCGARGCTLVSNAACLNENDCVKLFPHG